MKRLKKGYSLSIISAAFTFQGGFNMHFMKVVHLLENYHEIKKDYYSAPDSDLKLDIMDLEDAMGNLLTEEENNFLNLIKLGHSIPEIAERNGTYERATYRKRKKITQKLANFLTDSEEYQ